MRLRCILVLLTIGGLWGSPAAAQNCLVVNGVTTCANTFQFTAPVLLTRGIVGATDLAISSTATWNNSGVTFTHWKANVTDTTSATASLLLDLQVASTSKFAIRKDGAVLFAAGAATTPSLTQASDPDNGIYWGTNQVLFATAGVANWQISASGHLLATDNTFDIGASGATRPRTGYFGTSLVTPTVNATTAYQNFGITQVYFTTGNFTTAGNTNLQTITGLTIPLPATTVLNMPFSCKLTYSMATAAVSMSFGLQTDTLTPTNFQGMGHMETALTTVAYGDATVTNTTATVIVSGTPSAITTIWNAYIDGFIENPSGAATNINVMVKTSNSADLVTVYRDSWCRAF